jgi:hypothetical protein
VAQKIMAGLGWQDIAKMSEYKEYKDKEWESKKKDTRAFQSHIRSATTALLKKIIEDTSVNTG